MSLINPVSIKLIEGRLAIYHRVRIQRVAGESIIKTNPKPVACGVAVIVTHQQKVLFGKRLSDQDKFEWQLPGGWIKQGESPQQAARREVFEETNLELENLRFAGVTNNIFSSQNHSISLYFEAECVDASVLVVKESKNCTAWEWNCWMEITKNLYLPLQLFKQTEYQPFSEDNGFIKVAF